MSQSPNARIKAAIVDKLFIGNLTPEVTEKDFEKLLEEHKLGYQSVCIIKHHKLQTSRCFGFVRMLSEELCEEAVKLLHGKLFFGQALKVERTDSARSMNASSIMKKKLVKSQKNNYQVITNWQQVHVPQPVICRPDEYVTPDPFAIGFVVYENQHSWDTRTNY